MKNIFKKLHIGHNHDPNRSNDNTPSPPADHHHRHNSVVPPPTPPRPSPSPAAVTPTPRQDYYTSEEEYQLQLALALSVSGREAGNEPDNKETVRIKSDESVPGRSLVDGESQSRQYWVSQLDWLIISIMLLLFFTIFCLAIISIIEIWELIFS